MCVCVCDCKIVFTERLFIITLHVFPLSSILTALYIASKRAQVRCTQQLLFFLFGSEHGFNPIGFYTFQNVSACSFPFPSFSPHLF